MNMDPMKIFEEAMDNLTQGKYEESLGNFIQLQSAEITLEKPYNVLRRTYAIGGWIELAKVYPPAREKLDELLQERRKAFATDPSNSETKADLEALESRMP